MSSERIENWATTPRQMRIEHYFETVTAPESESTVQMTVEPCSTPRKVATASGIEVRTAAECGITRNTLLLNERFIESQDEEMRAGLINIVPQDGQYKGQSIKYYVPHIGQYKGKQMASEAAGITEQLGRERLSYPQDWPAYNEAQQEEIHLFDVFLRDIVEAIPEPEQKMGRPRLPLREQLFCSIQKVYSQLSSRRATGLYQHAAERGQIGHVPHFNTPSKLFNRPDVTPILQELVRLSALPVAGIETDFAIDSTGFRSTSYSAYCGAKHGTKQENDWVKAHFCVGTTTNIVASVEVTDGNCSDTVQFEPLLRRVVEDFQVREVSADMAYLSRSNLQLVTEVGGIPYIPFKKNSIPRSLGANTWKKMYHYFQLHREEFMEHYHKRSNAESTNAAIKRRFGEILKSKNFIAQKNELLAKVIAYNLTVIIHEMFEHGITPGFLHLKSPFCT